MDTSRKKFIRATIADAIGILLDEAAKEQEKHPQRAKRYVEMLWGLVKKYKVRLSEAQKMRFCRKCLTLWIPEKTVTVIFNAKLNAFQLKCSKCKYKKFVAVGKK